MNGKIILLALFVFIIFCDRKEKTWNGEVKYAGALRNIMMNGDISPKMQLSQLDGMNNLFALGAVGKLKGEIQIFDSEPLITFVEGEKLEIDKTLSRSASLIVYTQVKSWKEIEVPSEIVTRDQFEKYLEATAQQVGLDIEKPFPFMLSGSFKENDWHVIDWDENDKEHSHKKHIESGLFGTMNDLDLDMLGFFSKHHTAIFTHHTTNMHIHFKAKDDIVAGHSDGFVLGEGVILRLPIE